MAPPKGQTNRDTRAADHTVCFYCHQQLLLATRPRGTRSWATPRRRRGRFSRRRRGDDARTLLGARGGSRLAIATSARAHRESCPPQRYFRSQVHDKVIVSKDAHGCSIRICAPCEKQQKAKPKDEAVEALKKMMGTTDDDD